MVARVSEKEVPLKRSASLVIMLLATMAIAVPEARACSCGPSDPRDDLHESDGAFIGMYVGREPSDPADPFADHDYIFETEKVFKGEIGEVVEVRSASDGAACGLEYPEGARAALFLDEEEGLWRSNLCRTVQPGLLERAAAPLPAPDARGAPRLLVGGSFGEVRVIALGRAGRTAGYGYGEGDLHHMSLCPGGRRSVELASDRYFQPPIFVDVRKLSTLDVTSTKEAPDGWSDASVFPLGISCVDRDGAAVVAGRGFEKGATFIELRRFSAGATSRIYKGRATSAAIGRRNAYLSAGRDIFTIDLADGSRNRLTTLERAVSHLTLSPDGRSVAGYIGATFREEDDPAHVFVIRSRDGEELARTSTGETTYFGSIDWVSNKHLIQTSGAKTLLRTRSLQPVRGFRNWAPADATAVGCALFGVGYGVLARSSICEEKPLRPERTFFSPITTGILRLPKGTEMNAPPRP